MDLTYFIQQLINGLQLGSIYALVALGYTMVYGIAKLINFAHGDIIMVGSYFALICFTQFNLPLWATFLIVIALAHCWVLSLKRLLTNLCGILLVCPR